MKKIMVLILMCLFFGFISVAGAIDFDATMTTVSQMQQKTGRLFNLLNQAKTGQYAAYGLPGKGFTVGERQAFLDQYASLKTELQTLLNSLP